MSTPYVGFSNNTLKDAHPLKKGDEIHCPHCNDRHIVQCGTDSNGHETDILLFYSCGEKTYLAGIAGKLIAYSKADCSGNI